MTPRVRKPKGSGLFLQGFAIGFCACLDMLRDRGMSELPNGFAQSVVGFTDTVEAEMKSMPDIGDILKEYATPEMRSAVLKGFLDAAKQEEGR